MTGKTTDHAFLDGIFEQLIREEKRGRRFFMDAARFVTERKPKILFERLAADESDHVDTLEAMRRKLAEMPEPREKITRYAGNRVRVIDLSDMVEGYDELPRLDLFQADAFQKLLEAVSTEAILKFAMKIEYENARFLQRCMEAAPLQYQKEILKTLILEEKGHFLALKRLCASCQAEKK